MQMPDPEYRALKAVNYSGLKLFAECPLYYWERYLNPDRSSDSQSKALVIGSAVHCRVLEGLEVFSKNFVRAGKFDKRTKAGKEAFAAWAESIGSAQLLEPDDWDLVHAISTAVLKSPLASGLLEGAHGYSEEVCQAIDDETGLLCKCKVDRIQTIGGKTYIVDLKTCSRMFGGAGLESFSRQIAKFKYHWQAAFYTDLLNTAGDWGPIENFVFVAVEKEPPHAVAIFEVSDQMMSVGREQYRAALDQFKVSQETNSWPGFDKSIQTIDLPRWAL